MNITRPGSKHPLPANAKRVFKGEIFDVYQWEQKLFNGKSAVFEKLKRPDTVNIIPVTIDGEIILCEQEQPGQEPFVGLLGGRIDEGEDPLAAAKRELMEETGYKAKEYILWESSQPMGKIDWAIYTFIARKCEKVAEQSLDAGEKIKLFKVSFDELLKIAAKPNFRDTEIIRKFYQMSYNLDEMKKFKELIIES